ncbi:MAG: DUF3073 domain-containing protein [Cellulomonadaceae bacterium]|jgi:hypothetical protein|nr:DUF3073 domain-containing protein [Cellulomonadaceae bacterium]
MGRGRQKAKQTKVARELKAFSPPVDLSALEQELRYGGTVPNAPDPYAADDSTEDDPYAKWRDLEDLPEDDEEDDRR